MRAWMKRTLITAAFVSIIAPLGIADAQPVAVVAATQSPADETYSYLPGGDGQAVPLEVFAGGTLMFINLGGTQEHHGITSFRTSGGRPLFDTGLIAPGDYKEVPGVPSLSAGTYRFFCQKHPWQMGTLKVT